VGKMPVNLSVADPDENRYEIYQGQTREDCLEEDAIASNKLDQTYNSY
jgi:hypothetical protein